MKAFVIKKQAVAAAVIAAVLVAAAFLAPFIPLAVGTTTRRIIVLDAGHGGEDGGVTGAKTGVKESDLNLQMSKIVGEYFESAGFYVVYTRKNSRSLSGGAFSKRDDLDKRLDVINSSGAEAAISLHMNFYSSSSRRGAQVFFYKDSPDGEELARLVQDRLNADFNLPDTGRNYAALSAEKYLFWHSTVPIIIVECGFLSNPIDENNLSSPTYRQELGYSIFKGALIYLSNRTTKI